ncbi:RloB family protein [Sphingomonas xinjiangensis]|uniref:RloB-like protein n=1 Tax=Sphingomonas xinjiangensis TaxID=643568 RepID=A0A840YR48_9SPHN|nr:RloB family protein [Sphingomonas xinjiangensis]MBB5711911.1 hypothetical protein [Sphingomonas xinjiangensis]
MAKSVGVNPKRTAGGRTARDYTIVIAYDGELTEDEYFRGWKLLIPPSRLNLEHTYVRSGGNVLDAVENAIKKKKKYRNFAEFWCVCDVDDTDDEVLAQARNLANSNEIKLCTSNRCFEIWIALHFRFSDRHVGSEREAIDMVKEYHAQYGDPYKTMPFHILYDLTDNAIANARRLERGGSVSPSTRVHNLVRKLKQNCSE